MGELRGWGWEVREGVVVNTVGVRGTVPVANDEALQELGVQHKTLRKRVQTPMAREAIVHLNKIVR